MSKSQHVECGTWPSDSLPSSWEWAKFEDFFYDRTNSIKKIQRKDYCEYGKYPIIDQGQELIGGYSNSRETVAQTSLPCIVWGDHTRCIKYITQEFIQGADGVKVLEPSPAIDPRFSYLAMLCVTLPNKGYSRHFKFLKATTFPLPPLAEQRRIVAKLDSLTARIARARAELERAKRLQKQWFSKFLDSEFSCDGELLRLGELAEDVRYGTAQKCDYNPTLTPVLRIPNIASGNIDTSDLKHSTFTEKEIKKLSLCSGDLLIVRSNGSIDLVGQSAVADTQVSGFLFAGYLIRIRLKNKEVTPYFVHYWLRSPQARSAINAAAKSTSGVNNINSEQLKNLQIKIPSLSKQRIIVSRVIKAFSHADRLETEAERVLALLDRLESSLLAKAFRGELVPQDPDDEPASVLLDRIQAERAAAPKPKRGRKQSTQDMPVPRQRQTEKHD
ncbi:restriction endonuclease subunit S [Acetobacter orientalis]|uniref:restriction endonuclease subunit S n=1 Tax=Acetobacter orientalis TaxID=146474 RepID=UPI000A37D1D2|nr:restriction endonuclease subunit S [Acetobacter orientalis]